MVVESIFVNFKGIIVECF